MTEFFILKSFNINIHPLKAPTIKDVIWHPPLINWIKANTDGAMINKIPPKLLVEGYSKITLEITWEVLIKTLTQTFLMWLSLLQQFWQ